MALKRFNGNPEYFYQTVGHTHELTDDDIIPITHEPGTANDEDGKVSLLELKKYMDTAQNSRLDALEANDTIQDADIDELQGLIPSSATSSNKLVDKAYVDDSISTNTSTFRGSFATKAALDAYSGTKDNNDYAVVLADETHSNQTWRYKYDGSSWAAEYMVNDTAFTQAQENAIDSGITASDVSKLSGIEAGAQVNVQPDWNQTDNTADDFIKNKPTGLTVVDTVADGNMDAVTSNAVYDALQDFSIDTTLDDTSSHAIANSAVATAIDGINSDISDLNDEIADGYKKIDISSVSNRTISLNSSLLTDAFSFFWKEWENATTGVWTITNTGSKPIFVKRYGGVGSSSKNSNHPYLTQLAVNASTTFTLVSDDPYTDKDSFALEVFLASV